MDALRGPVSQEDIVRDTLLSAIDRVKRKKCTSDEIITTAIRLISDGIHEYGWTWEQFKTSEAELRGFMTTC